MTFVLGSRRRLAVALIAVRIDVLIMYTCETRVPPDRPFLLRWPQWAELISYSPLDSLFRRTNYPLSGAKIILRTCK